MELYSYERKVCKEQVDKLIYKLYVEQNFSGDGMIGQPYLFKVNERVYGSKESSIEPSSPLRNEFWHSI